MPAAREMLDYAGRHGHLIGLHSYYKPRPWNGVQGDRNAWGCVGGFWMLRERWHVDCWRDMGIHVPRFCVTEAGRDDIPGTSGIGKGYHDEPRTADGDYADFMAWFMRHMTAIPECAGVVDYGYGTIEERWQSFDLSVDDAMMQRMKTEMLKLPKGHPVMADIAQLRAEAEAERARRGVQINPNSAFGKWCLGLTHGGAGKGYWQVTDEYTSAAIGKRVQLVQHPGTKVRYLLEWLGGDQVRTHLLDPS